MAMQPMPQQPQLQRPVGVGQGIGGLPAMTRPQPPQPQQPPYLQPPQQQQQVGTLSPTEDLYSLEQQLKALPYLPGDPQNAQLWQRMMASKPAAIVAAVLKGKQDQAEAAKAEAAAKAMGNQPPTVIAGIQQKMMNPPSSSPAPQAVAGSPPQQGGLPGTFGPVQTAMASGGQPVQMAGGGLVSFQNRGLVKPRNYGEYIDPETGYSFAPYDASDLLSQAEKVYKNVYPDLYPRDLIFQKITGQKNPTTDQVKDAIAFGRSIIDGTPMPTKPPSGSVPDLYGHERGLNPHTLQSTTPTLTPPKPSGTFSLAGYMSGYAKARDKQRKEIEELLAKNRPKTAEEHKNEISKMFPANWYTEPNLEAIQAERARIPIDYGGINAIEKRIEELKAREEGRKDSNLTQNLLTLAANPAKQYWSESGKERSGKGLAGLLNVVKNLTGQFGPLSKNIGEQQKYEDEMAMKLAQMGNEAAMARQTLSNTERGATLTQLSGEKAKVEGRIDQRGIKALERERADAEKDLDRRLELTAFLPDTQKVLAEMALKQAEINVKFEDVAAKQGMAAAQRYATSYDKASSVYKAVLSTIANQKTAILDQLNVMGGLKEADDKDLSSEQRAVKAELVTRYRVLDAHEAELTNLYINLTKATPDQMGQHLAGMASLAQQISRNRRYVAPVGTLANPGSITTDDPMP